MQQMMSLRVVQCMWIYEYMSLNLLPATCHTQCKMALVTKKGDNSNVLLFFNIFYFKYCFIIVFVQKCLSVVVRFD